jgi:hypothetical protein
MVDQITVILAESWKKEGVVSWLEDVGSWYVARRYQSDHKPQKARSEFHIEYY